MEESGEVRERKKKRGRQRKKDGERDTGKTGLEKGSAKKGKR